MKEKQTDSSIVKILDLIEQTFGTKYTGRIMPKPASKEQLEMIKFLEGLEKEARNPTKQHSQVESSSSSSWLLQDFDLIKQK